MTDLAGEKILGYKSAQMYCSIFTLWCVSKFLFWFRNLPW